MKYIFYTLFFLSFSQLYSQDHSVAREWNELQLDGIRLDRARPTVTARNLWHVSAAMYDAWAAYDDSGDSQLYFLGNTISGFSFPFDGITIPSTEAEIISAREETISYAAYRILYHRYFNLPSSNEDIVLQSFDDYMAELGFDTNITSLDYSVDGPAALGNYIADRIIAFGLQDGSFEDDGYDNQYYESIYDVPPFVQIPESEALVTNFPGNPTCKDPNRWQPLTLQVAEDQNGNPLPIDTPEFLSPEWGNVVPFSLTADELDVKQRDGFDWKVYCDPGIPPHIDSVNAETGLTDNYKWGNAMVVIWSGMLAHDSGDSIDISPNNIGNVPSYPTNFDDFDTFYDIYNGLDTSQGYSVNPSTGAAYETQKVPMGDYGRVLAEFWADGPDSETPPGHWFTILNYVSDNPLLEKKWTGNGTTLSDLEWDIKTYFAMGGAMHDCAIAAWGIKGYYDYVRPISAIRYMGDQGQSSDQSLPNYSHSGLPLVPDYIELVEAGDPLVGDDNEHLNKIKVKSWKGPDYLDQLDLQNNIIDGVQDSTIAGVDWILAENWWPYQRPSFVTPPFAGYVSGHSTYSRAAAEVLELITGDAYFPGGVGVFPCPQNDFLVFEDGPSVDMELQWAKYTDASDQCSLSRIFGGIHPPADDLPGRIIGEKIGLSVFNLVTEIANPLNPKVESLTISTDLINDANATADITIEATFNEDMNTSVDPSITFNQALETLTETSGNWINATTFEWTFSSADENETVLDITVSITGGEDLEAFPQTDYTSLAILDIDTESPSISSAVFGDDLINESDAGTMVNLAIEFDEAMESSIPSLSFGLEDPTANSLFLSSSQPEWTSSSVFEVSYDIQDANEELNNINLTVSNLTDVHGNPLTSENFSLSTVLDTKAPEVVSNSVNTILLNENALGSGSLTISVSLDEPFSQTNEPLISFPNENPGSALSLDPDNSGFVDASSYAFVFDLLDTNLELEDIDFEISNIYDAAGNLGSVSVNENEFSIDTNEPEISNLESNYSVITRNEIGTDQFTITCTFDQDLDESINPEINFPGIDLSSILTLSEATFISSNSFEFVYDINDFSIEISDIDIEITGFEDVSGNSGDTFLSEASFSIDTQAPELNTLELSDLVLNELLVGTETFSVTVTLDSDLNTTITPILTFNNVDVSNSLILNTDASGYEGENTYTFVFDLIDLDFELEDASFEVTGFEDLVGNQMNSNEITGAMEIDTNAPIVTSVTPNALWVNENSVGTNMFYLDLVISEDASTANTPVLSITTADVENSLTENTENSEWISADTYRFSFNVLDIDAEIADIDLEITNVLDSALNIADSYNLENVFSLDTKAPEVIFANINATEISEVQTGNNFVVSASFSEPMLDQEQIVSFNPITPETLTETLNLWTTETSNETTFLISDEDEELTTAIILEGSMDLAGNQLIPYTIEEEIWIDNRQPAATYTANVYDITSTGGASFIISAEYDESINPDFIPTISFPVEDPELQLEFNASQSIWTDSTYTFVFDVEDISPLGFIDIEIEGTHDIIDNVSAPFVNVDFFSIMLDTFLVVNELSFNELKVYPNPAYAGEDVTLEIKSPETYSYKLLDALGREVELPELSISAGAVNFDSSNFSSGTYFLSVFKEGERKAIRFEIIK